jgi:hypothetical protein
MRTCPVCTLVSPDSAVVCDCGHAYDVVAAAKLESVGFTPARERRRDELGGGAKVLLAFAGWLVGAGIFGGITGLFDDPFGKLLARFAPVVGTACAALLLEMAAAPQARVGAPPKGNYFVRHWRGELSLRLSYWVNGPFASILGMILVRVLVEVVDTAAGLGAYRRVFLVGGTWLVMSVVLVWEVVGVWRSAGRLRPNADGRMEVSPWGPMARLIVVLSAVGFAFVCGASGGPALKGALAEARATQASP